MVAVFDKVGANAQRGHTDIQVNRVFRLVRHEVGDPLGVGRCPVAGLKTPLGQGLEDLGPRDRLTPRVITERINVLGNSMRTNKFHGAT